MRTLFSIVASASIILLVAANPVSAKSGDAYKVKKAECQARAKSMDFGIHLIKKNRWVKDCIAGRHAA